MQAAVPHSSSACLPPAPQPAGAVWCGRGLHHHDLWDRNLDKQVKLRLDCFCCGKVLMLYLWDRNGWAALFWSGCRAPEQLHQQQQ